MSSDPAAVVRTGMLRPDGRSALPGGVDASLDPDGRHLTLMTPAGVVAGDVPGLVATPTSAAAWWSARDGSWAIFAGVDGRAAIAVADLGERTVRTVGVIPRSSSPVPLGLESVRYADDGHGGALVLFEIGLARIAAERALRWLVVHDDPEAEAREVTAERATFTSPHGDFHVGVDDGAVTAGDGTAVLLVPADGYGTVWLDGRRARLHGVGRGGVRWTADLTAVPDRATTSHGVVWSWSGTAVEGVRLLDGGRVPGPVPCERCQWPAPASAMDELAFDEERATRLLECRSCGAHYELDVWNDRRQPLLLTAAEARERYRGAV